MKDVSPRDGQKNTWLLIAAGVLLGIGVGLAVVGLFSTGALPWESESISNAPAVPKQNTQAENFLLQTIDGRAISLADSKGKIVLLNFWATWCGPCRAEMPLLQEAQDRYSDRIVVLAVNDGETINQVKNFVNELELRMAVLLDPDRRVTEQYNVRGFPTTVFIGPDGKIRYQHIGVLNQSMLDGYLSDLGIEQ